MKLNNLSRLTALLLALTMLFQFVALAESTGLGSTGTDYDRLMLQGILALSTPEERYEKLIAKTDDQLMVLMSLYYAEYRGTYPDALCYCYPFTEDADNNLHLYPYGDENHLSAEDGVDFDEDGVADTCPWSEATTETPVNPDQPPLYYGKPEGKQYTETLEHTLPMEEDRAVILQTGARAILTSENSTPGVWQVYTGEEWVDIQGETSNVIEVTEAKLNSIFARTGIAQLRYFDKANNVVLDEVSVTTKEIANGDYVDLPEQLSLITRAEGSDVETADGKYYVYVYYVYGDDSKHSGKTVADPMIAEVTEGENYKKDVTSPVIPGYATSTEDAVIEIDTEGYFSYTVYYHPAEVKFKVEHYQQNLLNDDYTLAATDELTGTTEDPVGQDLEKDTANTTGWEGFYALLYDETTEIAADGSTVIEIYYDRNYYLMKFNANGGYGAESVFARVGAGIGTPKQPTRAGYTFAGWKDEETGTVYTTANFPYATMPAKNTSFVAQWTSNQTSYDVVFWYENADDDGYSQAGVLYDRSANSGDIVNGADYATTNFTGKDAEHFTYSHADQNVVVKGDGSTVVNVYFSRNVYTLTFVTEDEASDCTTATHSHVDACKRFVCTLEEHNHTTAGCTIKCSHTTHELACYTPQSNGGSLELVDKPNRTLTHQGNGIYTYNYNNNGTRYVLNIGDNWYQCSEGSNFKISLNCSHSHSDACYTCNKIAYTHSDSCYEYICGKHEHTHSNGDCTYIVTAKYDADITAIWLNDPIKSFLDDYYVYQSSVTGDYYSFLEKMPGQDITMTSDLWSGYVHEWYYYLEVLPNKDYSGITTRTANGKTYYLYKTTTILGSSMLNLTYAEDYFDITGFKQRDSSVPRFSSSGSGSDTKYTAYLYYTRESYDLTFSNNGDVVEGKGGSFLYEADISGQYFVPDYPADLEAGAYTFDGWYTSPFFGDTKFEFTTTDEDGNTVKTTMPAKDITLYAHWAPITHEVNIYVTEGGQQIGSTETVDHNDQATEIDDPTNGSYTFVGWFYMDGETEKAFDFSMPITKDMEIYAKWISNTLMTYTIRYAVQTGTDDNGDPIYEYIAEDTTGSALAGTTKTFQAKYGDELNAGYQTGYFPHTNSHSLVIDIEDETKNVFTFVYTPAEKAPYTVYYLAKTLKDGEDPANYVKHHLNGEEYFIIADTKTVADNTMVAVSEKYVYVQGYMPDAIQKQLILSANPADNVLYFFYTVDNEHALVQIIHYVQNATGDEYSIYQNYSATTHTIGEVISESTLDITGFEFVKAEKNGEPATVTNGVVTAQLTANGLLLELYYDRILYDYEFKFLDQDTNKPVADPVTGKARYEASVSQDAKDVTGYTLVSDETQSMVIDDEPTNNVRIFYYTENKATINYVVVGPEGCGTVTPASETVKVVTGTAAGSTAAASSNTYKFVGWYGNEDCTGTPLSTGPSFIPKQPDNGEWVDGTTYYALFDWNVSTLTVVKDGMQSGESAVVQVEITDSEGTDTYTIVLNANVDHDNDGKPSVIISDVLIGSTYTVTELDPWTWRYSNGSVEYHAAAPVENGKHKIVADAATNTVTVTNSKNTYQWLSDESAVKNDLSTGTGAGYNNPNQPEQ